MNRRQFFQFIPALPQTCQQIIQEYQIDIGELDPNARYMVLVRPDQGQNFDDWRKRMEITEEIRDCFQDAGFERGDVGILFLRGYGIEIVEVVTG